VTKIRILIPSEKFETTATQLNDEAPETCETILRSLPIEGLLTHAMISGNQSVIEMRDLEMVKLEPENWVYSMIPGDIAYWYSMWGDNKYLRDNTEFSEIIFTYGRYTRLRDLSLREAAANLFATFDSKLAEFAAISQSAHHSGPISLILERESK
jgi:hypothetical protein